MLKSTLSSEEMFSEVQKRQDAVYASLKGKEQWQHHYVRILEYYFQIGEGLSSLTQGKLIKDQQDKMRQQFKRYSYGTCQYYG